MTGQVACRPQRAAPAQCYRRTFAATVRCSRIVLCWPTMARCSRAAWRYLAIPPRGCLSDRCRAPTSLMRCHAHRPCAPEVNTLMRPLPGLFANRLFRYPHVRFLRFGRPIRAPSFSPVRPGCRLWPVLHDCIAGCRGACARTATHGDHGNPAKLAADRGGRPQGPTPAGAGQRCGRLPQDHSRFLRDSQRWQ